MRTLKALGIGSFILMIAAIFVMVAGQRYGMYRVGASSLIDNPHHLQTTGGWYSISGDSPRVTKVLGCYYVSTIDTRPHSRNSRRAWEARGWMIDDDLKVILDNQIAEQKMADNNP